MSEFPEGREACVHLPLNGRAPSHDEASKWCVAKRSEIPRAITSMAVAFLGDEHWEEHILDVLANIGKAMAVSRIQLFENTARADSSPLTSLRFEWVDTGIPAQWGRTCWQNVVYRERGPQRWEEQLSRGDTIVGLWRDLPVSERDFLAETGVFSLARMPVMVGETWWGFIGFDDCVTDRGWCKTEMDVLKMVTQVLASAIHRQKMEDSLRQAKEAAEEATRVKDTFVSLVAHDLRSPLSSIVGLLGFLLDDGEHPLSDGQRALVQDLLASGNNINEMIENILNISRLKTGRITPKKVFFNVGFLVDGVVQRLNYLVVKKRLCIKQEIAKELRFFADPALFGEVVQNMVSNAIKFSYSGGTIRIFSPADSSCAIAVQDQGIGIPPDMISRIFCLEERVSRPGTAGERGAGFGLPFSFNILEAHAGSMNVESIPGHGSVFTVFLPKVSPRILVVDDQTLDRFMLASHLEVLDVDVVEAENSSEALALMEDRLPHLVLSDITMPGMNGFQLLTSLKKNPKTKDIPVIMVTGDEAMKTRDQAFRLGAVDFTVKPVIIHEFLPRVKHYLGG